MLARPLDEETRSVLYNLRRTLVREADTIKSTAKSLTGNSLHMLRLSFQTGRSPMFHNETFMLPGPDI
jgi:hypothetical protein